MQGKPLSFLDYKPQSKIDSQMANQMARQRYQEEWATALEATIFWKRMTFVMVGLSFLAVGGLVFTISQNKIVPYVVAVDKLGTAVGVRRADVAAAPNSAMIKSQLARWIENTRAVYTDVGAEKVSMKESFGSVRDGSAAQQALLSYLNDKNPYKLAQEKTIAANIQSVQAISDKTWRVEWKETEYNRTGGILSEHDMQATVTIAISPPTDEATILLNPLGIYVDSFTWSQRL